MVTFPQHVLDSPEQGSLNGQVHILTYFPKRRGQHQRTNSSSKVSLPRGWFQTGFFILKKGLRKLAGNTFLGPVVAGPGTIMETRGSLLFMEVNF